MASQTSALLPAIVITICLNVSIIAAAATAIVWDSKTSRYVGDYNLDKGPVFYEAYYPDTRDTHQEKRLGQNTVLETSFQVPFERIAYPETADHPVTISESLVVDNEKTLPRKQRKTIESRHNYDAVNQLASSSNKHSMIFNDDKNMQTANIEEISQLVRRAISRDLENWNVLEEYLDRTAHHDPMPQLGMYSKEIHKNREGDNYVFPVNRRFIEMDSSGQSSFETSLPQKSDARDGKQRPVYFEGVDANESTMTNEMSVTGMQAVDVPPPIDVISDSLPPENIYQPRPQLIRYTFFKRLIPLRLHEKDERAIDQSTPRTYGDNLTRKKVIDGNRERRARENVKVTSIEISELPRHKTRHHHGEWPKRDYSSHRSQSATYSTVS